MKNEEEHTYYFLIIIPSVKLRLGTGSSVRSWENEKQQDIKIRVTGLDGKRHNSRMRKTKVRSVLPKTVHTCDNKAHCELEVATQSDSKDILHCWHIVP